MTGTVYGPSLLAGLRPRPRPKLKLKRSRTERRVKCDEQRPACLRCTSTDRPCDGYRDPPALTPTSSSSSSYPTTATAKLPPKPIARSRPLLTRPLSIPAYHLFPCDQERRSFQFFLTRTVPQLAGDFECAFWERLLLQSVHQEPAIRHVTVALGSLHESFEQDADAGPFPGGLAAARSSRTHTHTRAETEMEMETGTGTASFALRQYLRGMRCLMPMSGSGREVPLDVCLISCVLFACFEAMRGHYGPAITHITSGLNILSELRTTTSTPTSNSSVTSTSLSVGRTPYVPIDILCGLFTRLQAQIIVTIHRIGAARCNLWPTLTIDLHQPIIFHSLADARETLEIYTYYYRQRSTELQYPNPGTDPTTSPSPSPNPNLAAVTLRDTCLILLSRWSAALDDFLRARSLGHAPLTARERRAVAVLQLRKIDCVVALDSLQDAGKVEAGDHVQWDRYCKFFERMVVLGEGIVGEDGGLNSPSLSSPFSSPESTTRETGMKTETEPEMTKSKPKKKTFSLDLGIISGMFNVAVRCRDPVIRRRAVRVLRASAVREGVWDSVVVAAVAEKWIEIEEEGLGVVASCADVPAGARLADFLPVFDGEESSALVYFRRAEAKAMDEGGVRSEVFTW
ncbi:hypothetical protein BO70DRAFT_363006 [Aspergillus heteromorphus CBS 117.55]|uniref:Zn(2)-C6 fungal-type domain-containing protein n=1 Tax=Aspergillus heteromorphus CBS 117.55 TaxID=1448321 RepID=A0A317W1X4_9EURO|nr:uncharacterized protein BO70DRAFT_363006 [Aspergillus heteromorphus CBS 117.55]PWY79247.1 hypothetical protein BO70DRAFT_363006 [Aspergillus heteromorphus CBS 117.55]